MAIEDMPEGLTPELERRGEERGRGQEQCLCNWRFGGLEKVRVVQLMSTIPTGTRGLDIGRANHNVGDVCLRATRAEQQPKRSRAFPGPREEFSSTAHVSIHFHVTLSPTTSVSLSLSHLSLTLSLTLAITLSHTSSCTHLLTLQVKTKQYLPGTAPLSDLGSR